MSQTKTLKKFALLLVSVLSIFILAACSTGNKTPYGDISNDTTYIEINGKSVSQKELYDALRYNANDHLLKFFDEKTFESELSNIDFTKDADRIEVEKTINSVIFGQTDIATIAKLSEVSRARSIIKYVDNLVLTDPSLIAEKDALITEISNVVSTAVNSFDSENDNKDFKFNYSDKLLNRYKLAYAQKLFAKAQLTKLQETEKGKSKPDANYITDEAMVAKYNSDYKGKFNTVSALIVKFDNEKEAEIARYNRGLKSNSDGSWFKLPNISDAATLNDILANTSTEVSKDSKAYAKSILENKEHITITNEMKTNGINPASSEYATFYSKYTINIERDTALSNEEVLSVFVEIYNELNTYSNITTNVEELTKQFTYKYDDTLFTANTQLRTAVANLKDSAKDAEEGVTVVKPYSKSVSLYGSNRYLVYFLGIDEDKDIVIKDANDEDKEVFADTDKAKEYKEKIYKELFDAKLTDTYIKEEMEKLYKDAKIEIYDPMIRTLFNFSNSLNAKGGFKDNNTLATLTIKRDDKDITTTVTVKDLYDALEKVYGLSTSSDILLTRILSEKYSITDAKRKELETSFKATLDNFASDGLASSGYPKSMGQDAFLTVAFNASSNKEAFEKQYVMGNLRTQFKEDIDSIYANAGVYAKFADVTKLAYENNKGLNASHLLVYVDFNNDGSPDDPATLSDEVKAKLAVSNDKGEDQVTQLIELLKEVAETNYSNLTAGLQGVATLYNDSTRYELLSGKLDYAIANKFIEFRKLGLKVKYESLNAITNETNFPTSESQLDSTFYDYVINDLLNSEVDKNALPQLDTTKRSKEDSINLGLETAFGWHTLVTTGTFEAKSAKEESDSDSYVSSIKNPTNPDAYLTSKNPNETLSYEQIAIYIKESALPTGVESLSSSVKEAITAYFEPVYSKFTGTNMSTFITLKVLFGDKEIKLANADLNARLQTLLEVNRNQFFAYSIFDASRTNSVYTTAKTGNTQFEAIYGTWFTIFN
ncbi:conserved hypothetical protein [Alteracholeplasma palmae J233]|uniref:Lipoprotein n=1 Tax=Alteracholeplasma palmae (strain ATCC 49389 / J233) TaxID=1318466 RepID=U4KLN7_ALTPJ|nr:hypothetical protein [Alteracholeplasma palmae]CCV64802.1 conserved hypothetical protein [Alteracholeplasma palmae J233]